jgi:ketol-acid reductoisomerase
MPMLQKDKAKKQIAVIGYGSQGRALALNLRDSGFPVVIGLRPRSRSRSKADAEGLEMIRSIPDAVASCDIVCFAFPDHLHGPVYEKSIREHLQKDVTLLFLHGLSVHFGFVRPPTGADVILLAPHSPGVAVREKFLGDRSISAFYAVEQDASGTARRLVFELARACGFRRERLVETTFEHEAVGDMFGEQVVLCGGLSALIKTAFEVLVERGHKPEHAYLEVAYQLDLIVELIKKYGISGMFERISVAAKVGSAKNGPRIVGEDAKASMEQIYDDIASGRFARYLAALEPRELADVGRTLQSLSPRSLERAARKYSG